MGYYFNKPDHVAAAPVNTLPCRHWRIPHQIPDIELAVEACPYGFKPELYKEDEMPSKTALYPALVTWNGHNGLPKFDAVKDEDFAPAFEAALLSHEREIDAISGNAQAPTFENTVTALEIAGDELSRISALFWNKAGRIPIAPFRHWSGKSHRKCRGTIRRSA